MAKSQGAYSHINLPVYYTKLFISLLLSATPSYFLSSLLTKPIRRIEILEGNFRKASFYPLQTFSKSKDLDYKEVPFFVESDYDNDLELLKNLALNISKKVMISTYEKRKYIHLTAVFACNFVNHLFARAKEISDSQEIPFAYFLPLIKETTAKIEILEPKLAQTGPAIRNDERVLKAHEDLITDEEQLKIYKIMNESIKKMYEL